MLAIIWVMFVVRWAFPRFRYDQIMRLGWKMMLPVSLTNVALTAAVFLWAGRDGVAWMGIIEWIAFLFFIGFVVDAYLILLRLFQREWLSNRPSLIVGTMLIIVGVQLVLFGLLAEMVAFSYRRENDYSIVETEAQEDDLIFESPFGVEVEKVAP